MATNPHKRQDQMATSSVVEWLLDSDPSIRWQVKRDLSFTSSRRQIILRRYLRRTECDL